MRAGGTWRPWSERRIQLRSILVLGLAVGVPWTSPVHGADSELSDEPIPIPDLEDLPKRAGPSELSDEPIPIPDLENLPERAAPLLEIGPDFLGTGNIPRGITLPTGAVWTPALWLFGNYRTAFNYFDNGQPEEVLEWANRLDLFLNLQLSGTERVLAGFSPLRHEDDFTSYQFEPDDGFQGEFDLVPTVLFFEGEFGEIFPNLDPYDTGSLDIGFSVGRQPVFFQDGIMINDQVDSFALTRDTIVFPNYSPDTRLTGLFGWHELHRGDNNEDHDAMLFGLFSETDTRISTFALDAAYVLSHSDGQDGIYLGASSTQRIGQWNTTFRALGSIAPEGRNAGVDNGLLVLAEISTTPFRTDDIVYGNFFGVAGNYTSVARDPITGGPLGQTGLLFTAVGLGDYGSALSNDANSSVGGSIGYQKFFNNARTQVTLEVGGRLGTKSNVPNEAAIGFRFQQAIGPRYILRFDGFLAGHEDRGGLGRGARVELMVRF